MIDSVRSFVGKAPERSATQTLLQAAEYLGPAPYDATIRFTRKCLKSAAREQEPAWRRFAMVYVGCYPSAVALYDFSTYGTDAYLTNRDEERLVGVNGRACRFLDDKQRFYDLLVDRGYEAWLPARFGVIRDGVLLGAGLDFAHLLDERGQVVLKGRGGAGGRNVFVCESDGAIRTIDGHRFAGATPTSYLRSRRYLVTEFCKQAAYAERIYPHTANTIRIITMHPRDGEPFIAGAYHRFGSDRSRPVDNFSQGGLSAHIGADGRLSRAVRYHEGIVNWHDRHPDSGAEIAGVEVPDWDRLRSHVRSLCTAIPEFVYVGWDIIVRPDGTPAIIEGNSHPNTRSLQVHQPLLVDDRVRSFYHNHLST